MTAIREARKRRGLTQDEAASRIGISYSMYCKLEAGLRGASQKTMARVSEFYGVPVDALFFAESNH